MNRMTCKLLTATFLMAAVMLPSGCKSADQKSAQGQNHPGQLGDHRVSEADAKFETSQDPPFTTSTRVAAGQLAETQGDRARAIGQYCEALKLDPKCKDAYYRLGVLYCEVKHYPDAIKAWKGYVNVTGEDPTAYANLGFCYQLAGQHTEAAEAYIKGIAKDPKNNACRVNYGLMLVRDNRINEGVVQLQAVLSEAEVHYNLASIFEQTGRKDQARAEYRLAIDVDPNMSDAQARLAAMQ
jgi:tetratricopeptide (TPR) repeat protein